MARVRTHVESFGQTKILAIKIVRELGGFGLREAKALVEDGTEFEFELDGRTEALLADAARKGVQIVLDEHAVVASPAASGGSLAVRIAGVSNKIAAIKLVRQLTQVGLAEAKGIVDRGDVITDGLDASAAQAIVEQFAASGARAEIVAGGAAVPAPVVARADVPDPYADDDF
ncbi:ribosomal protein L7/L12 [Enhygromyxa salina]|uniref:50S ribosomal protein L7/L12 n=1 Tax=Enhygromyxa salina TaxID=215803 RepID=A0A2S9XQS4_9BACT|nr:ribosomal protein L7/L12 [Enhygromyxa salina]PRP95214.1 50S ribosomal protein L7/L12 [Enhygromyxa salina]